MSPKLETFLMTQTFKQKFSKVSKQLKTYLQGYFPHSNHLPAKIRWCLQFQLCNKQVLARIFALPQGYFRGQSIINIDNFLDIFLDNFLDILGDNFWDDLGNNLGDNFGDISWVLFRGHFQEHLWEHFWGHLGHIQQLHFTQF